jgi:hypothetical protein
VSIGVRGIFRFVLASLLLAAALPFVPSPAAAVGSTYWVDAATGSDTAPGTEAEPFKTITKAVTAANMLDTIMVRPGTYGEASGESFPVLLGGSSLKSTGGAASTIIQGNGVSEIIITQYCTDGDVISGFTFTGGKRALVVFLDWDTGPDSPSIEHNVFESNDAGSNGGAALRLYGSGSGSFRPLIHSNVFRYNTTTSMGGAIRVSGYVAVTITENEFVENTADDGGAVILLTNAVVCRDSRQPLQRQ